MNFFWFDFCIFYLLIPGSKGSLSLVSSANDDFCITTDLSAMYYTTSNGTVRTEDIQFLPPTINFCDFEDTKCVKIYKLDPWELAYSVYDKNAPILDLRWERLNNQELPFKKKENLAFLTLLQLNDLKYFKLPISLLAEEVHLLLCDRKDVPNANCYWFALQGWDSKYTAMRRCKSGEITGFHPSGGCIERREEKRHPEDFPLFLSKEKWSHIIIERNEKNLYLKTYNDGKEETIIHFSENDEMFQLQYLIGHRKDKQAYCKIHTNHYMRSTTSSEVVFENWFSRRNGGFCLSILLKTCRYCSTLVSFLDEKSNIMLEKSISTTNDFWVEDKIILNISNSMFMKVKFKTILEEGYTSTGHKYWSFDNIRQCVTEEYRITPQSSKQKLSECRLLTNNQVVKRQGVTRYKPDNTCSTSSSIGSSCISCNVLKQRNKKTCKKMKICENIGGFNICYCSPGYTGYYCSEECPSGSFGYLCQEQCGFCLENCDVSDGRCNCIYSLFEEPTCKMPKYDQYLAKAPKVIRNTAESCEIQWNSEDFVGKNKPKYYLLQYTDFSNHSVAWSDYGEIGNIEDNDKGSIGKLKRSKKYGIRVLISDKQLNIKNLQFTALPYTICNTTCNGWNENEINVLTTSDSVRISLHLAEDKCDVSLYAWNLEYHQGKIVINGSASLDIKIKQLVPFQNYRIVFFSSSDKIIKDFKTLEGVPSKVENIELEESAASYMKIKWQVPKYPKGDIQIYVVKYQKVRRISCKSKGWFKSYEANTTVNIIELNNLEPYSEYKITINAINRLEAGDEASTYFQTQGLDYFKTEENLNVVSIWIESLQRGASITFPNIQCEKLLGPLNFSVSLQCISEWCLETEVRSEILQSFQGTLNLKGLQPYCTYICDVSFCRNGNCKIHENRTFETKASVPNELKEVIVIATGESFMWIRWLPPYPPTGRTQIYRIITRCVNCRFNHENIQYPTNLKRCSIWPEYYCHKIDQYVYYKYQMSLQIEAANEENYIYKEIAYIPKILVEEVASEEPYNVSVTLNLDNTMEIFWNHPNRTNGILDYFHIRIGIADESFFNITYKPVKWKLKYNIQIAKAVPAATDLSIIIIAVNNKYPGHPAQVDVSSYPPKPDLLDSQIYIANYTKTTISISLNTNQVEYVSPNVKKFLLVLINDHSPETKDSNLEILEKIMNITFEKELRVVSEQDLGKLSWNILNFTIGDGNVIKQSSVLKTNIVNKPLQEARYYTILVVLLNEYKGKYRHTIYNATTLTQGNPEMTPPPTPKSPEREEKEEKDNSSGGSAAYALLLLLLLIPIIIIGVILKRKNIVLIRPIRSIYNGRNEMVYIQ
ncbi:uncharacterized protein LOC123308157 isoform X1 [Coccinella septempunctata]|uniref:uncharacterized protein LOC123308157 isoform X1 n=2 Tax=Coccinella septempunctata TaxID=41139 RepID=UPI001D0836EB|nr:uncharacterized protein LOC123308157 isoform X1 [Coccinella septempunctata]